MYRTDKQGLIPALLTKWFDERVEYRKLSKKFHEEGDKEKSDYFDRMFRHQIRKNNENIINFKILKKIM